MMLMTPATGASRPQEGQAFKSDVVPTKELHEKDVSSTDHTYELTDDEYDYDDSNFYDLDFVSGQKIHKQEKLCDSSRDSPAGGTTPERECLIGTAGADTTPLDIILGSLESLLRKFIRAAGSVGDITQEKHQQRQTARGRGSNKNQRKKILDIDRLITQCYGHLLSSNEEDDIYQNGDEGDEAQHARLCQLENIRIDIDRVISKCGLSAVAGDDERLKRMTEEIPDIMRVSREYCNATLYDSIRSLETFLP
jgi:hypothetical protein